MVTSITRKFNKEPKRIRNIDSLNNDNIITSRSKGTIIFKQRRDMISIVEIPKKGREANPLSAIGSKHKIYIVAEDDKYIYATPRTHIIPEYNPKLKGLEVGEEIVLKDDSILERPLNTWMHGEYNDKPCEFNIIFSESASWTEKVITSIVFAIPKNKFKESIDYNNVSEIDSMDKNKKYPIEEYKDLIQKTKEALFKDKEGNNKKELEVYFLYEKEYKIINTNSLSRDINILEIEKQNNLFHNKEKDCYEEILLPNKNDITIE